MTDTDELMRLMAQQHELRGKVFCPECYEWKDELIVVKTEDGERRMCGDCDLNYCTCGRWLEHNDEKDSGECRRCAGDIG